MVYGTNRQKFSSVGVGWRRFSLSFPRTAQATLELVQTMIDTVGNHSSFIFCNFNTDRTYEIVEPCYVSLNGSVGFRHTRNMKFEYSLELEEDK